MKEALEALERDRPDEASRHLRQQLERDRSNPLLLALLGIALTRMGQLDEAIDSLDQAHYLEPDNAQILVDYGIALLEAGRLQPARSRLEAALRLDPGNGPALRSLGELYQRVAAHGGAAPSSMERQPPPRSAPPPSGTSQMRPPSQPAAPVARRREEFIPPPPQPSAAMQRSTRIPSAFADPLSPGNTTRWEPEPLPSFLSLVQATVQLWGQQPLIWLLLFGLPGAVAGILAPFDYMSRWVAVLLWSVAFGIGSGPTLLGMTNHWIFGKVLGGSNRSIAESLLHGTAFGLLYAMLFVAPFAVVLALRSPLPASAILPGVLLMTLPFHALLAPALVLSATDGPPGWPALKRAWSIAGRRSWLHLMLFLAVGVVIGGGLTVVGWSFAVTVKGQGATVARVMEIAGLALGQSLWAALVTITGLDALSAADASVE
jgi:hypothetical protein